jgi:N-acetylmuramoyl-L-alanine amidase
LVAGLALSSWALGRALEPEVWPDAKLHPATATIPVNFGTRRVVVDPGHGAPGNTGNKNAFCRDEQSFTLALAEDLATALSRTGHFDVKLTRRNDQLVPYGERIREAEAWPADVFLSLHSDVRGKTELWQPEPGTSCSRSRSAPGLSVLWSDHGEPSAIGARVGIARALGRSLEQSGFLAYAGAEYAPTYAADDVQRGVFVDRRAATERVFVLWRPKIPSVIIETHNALDDREARRWDEPETRAVFAEAVIRALVAAL